MIEESKQLYVMVNKFVMKLGNLKATRLKFQLATTKMDEKEHERLSKITI
jgi:hypothetical protein